MDPPPHDEGLGAWERVAEAAADLFLRQGFTGVSLKKIGDRLQMKPASLYFHCPDGKAELYVRSLTYMLERYRAGLDAAAAAPFPDCVLAMAAWMVGHPPVDFRRIVEVDGPALAQSDPERAEQLPSLLHAAVFEPFHAVFIDAASRGDLAEGVEPTVLAAATVALVEGLGTMHGPPSPDNEAMTRALVQDALDVLLRGAIRAAEFGFDSSG